MKLKLLLTITPMVLLNTAWAVDKLAPAMKLDRPVMATAMERSDESVLLVEMSYSNGKWQAKPITILPCGGPSKVNSVSPTRSMFQLKSRDGKALYRRYIENPRIVLVEDPKEDAPLLKETKFTLRIPLRSKGRTVVNEKDVYNFEFFEQERKSQKPVAQLNLSKVLPALSKQRKAGKLASCQLIEPRMEKLPELKAGPSNAISPDSLASMLKKDKGMLISWGIENGVTPDELKKLAFSHKEQWPRLQLQQRTVDNMIDEYGKAYKNR